MIKKRYFVILLSAVIISLTASCSSNKAEVQAVETDVSLEEAAVGNTMVHNYRMELSGQEEAKASGLIPRICLFEDQSFTFSFDVLSSYYAVGTYEMTDEKLILKTNDKERTYVFHITDEGITFIESESYDVRLTDEDFGVAIRDGSLFIEE
ncbi:MAG: hypothetical protein HFE83_10110 [Lachnospiraceae bacterium]|nr:hypothetical protein [Lachnospiraceae bacterium]